MARPQQGVEYSELYLVGNLQGEVDGWVKQGWGGVTPTTRELLNYWFHHDESTAEHFHECQRRAIETIIYCVEVLENPALGELFLKVAPEALVTHLPLKQEVDAVRFPKYALKMATGTGKTWVLNALIVWQYFNKLNEEAGQFTNRFMVVTPGHEVLNRMLDSFKGKRDLDTGFRRPETADLNRRLFMPDGAQWRELFQLEILEPHEVNTNTSAIEGSFLYLTNWQQFRLKKSATDLWAQYTGEDVEEAPRGEVILDFLSQYPDIMIMNDEAHHVHDKKSPTGDELIWRKFMDMLYDRLKSQHGKKLGAFAQVDFSATPFFGSGAKREYFPHIVYDYALLEAMRSILVKQLFLEERQAIGGEALADLDFRAERDVPDAGHRRGEVLGLSPDQKLLLDIGRLKLEQLATEFRERGITKKPVLMVLCENTDVANRTKQHFANISNESGINYDDKQVMVVHSELKGAELKAARERLDKIDADTDPLRVVISVLMLREGFDKNNICVVVVLRATEADLLLEQIVGRGLRLMFPPYAYPELQDSKIEAYSEIRRNKAPSNSLDFLFIVEHPRFREFYEKLKQEGYVIGGGDSSTVNSVGDLLAIDAAPDRIPFYDISWPIQVYDEGKLPDLNLIEIDKMPQYSGDIGQLNQMLSKMIIQERHVETGKKTKTWRLDNEHFDYNFFLRNASRAVAFRDGKPIITSALARVAELIDDYTSNVCFGKAVDFSLSENYNVLNYSPVFDFIVQTVHQTIIKHIEGFNYETKGLWAKLSDVPRIMMRESKSVETDKSIYPRIGFQQQGGGFEKQFMESVLNDSAEVLAYAKLDRRHRLKISYRDHTAILRNYEVDFIVKTAHKNYLVETKGDRDMASPNVAVKARAAVAWCEQAAAIKPTNDLKQSHDWEYLIISEKLFNSNKQLGFEAFVPMCRALRDNVIAESQSQLFI